MALSLSKVILIQKLSSRPLLLRVYATRKVKGKRGYTHKGKEDGIERRLHVVKSGPNST